MVDKVKGIERYEKIKKLGEGGFGQVYQAQDLITKEIVAVKKIHLGNAKQEGVHFTALREIKLLKEFGHTNVIRLIDVFVHHYNIHLVYEFMATDVENIINDSSVILSQAHIKGFMKQILQGVAECHKKWVLHRDLKPANLLVDKKGHVKLADFGLARIYGSPGRRYTPKVVTLWYRAPELLYGAEEYGPPVDMWSVGCIFAHLMLRKPYFFTDSDSELEMLSRIFSLWGTPSDSDWPGMTLLPGFVRFERVSGTPLRQVFSAAPDDALDLLSRMLRYNPASRISASDALEHRYFTSAPEPTPADSLPLGSKVSRSQEKEEEENTTHDGEKNSEKRESSPAKPPLSAATSTAKQLELSSDSVNSSLFSDTTPSSNTNTPATGQKRKLSDTGFSEKEQSRSVRRRLNMTGSSDDDNE
eukprot:gb/GECH01004324.1/.p1 GENE.gb/GECH01004324.1/~~gb/GECH01004324.1/.p1  ORF type:complete len:416 (+),score=79.12 gb/GECH01004324.1/:1-1248(+)